MSHFGSLKESDAFCIFDKMKVMTAITTLLPKITVQTITYPPDSLTKAPVAEKQRPAKTIQAIAAWGESLFSSTIQIIFYDLFPVIWFGGPSFSHVCVKFTIAFDLHGFVCFNLIFDCRKSVF